MLWYIISASIFLVAIVLVVVNYIRDRRYLRKLTKEAVRDEVKKELAEEIEAITSRKEKFQKALDEAARKSDRHD